MSDEIVEQYSALVEPLDDGEVAAMWRCVLFGQQPANERLRVAANELSGLRDKAGRASAARRVVR